LRIGEPLRGRLMLIETLDARVREVRFERDPECALCGEQPSIGDARLHDDDSDDSAAIDEIEASQLDAALADAILLDVREPHEAVLGSVDGAIAIPATQLEARMHELDSARRYVVACRVGAKSRWALARLHDAGFKRLLHLRGGLLAYAAQHDDFAFF
jgi:adenylyltransferase/sulfurtransferase